MLAVMLLPLVPLRKAEEKMIPSPARFRVATPVPVPALMAAGPVAPETLRSSTAPVPRVSVAPGVMVAVLLPAVAVRDRAAVGLSAETVSLAFLGFAVSVGPAAAVLVTLPVQAAAAGGP